MLILAKISPSIPNKAETKGIMRIRNSPIIDVISAEMP